MSIEHLLNANIHRMKEGARVLEDIARFILRDNALFQAVRDLRHQLKNTHPVIDINEDLGGVGFKENNQRANLLQTVQANAIRMQEALRVLEEFSEDNKPVLKQMRYSAYELQQQFYQAVQNYMQTSKLHGIYLIIDTSLINISVEKMIDVINASAVSIIQYRNKRLAKRDQLDEIIKIKQLLRDNVLLIINDHIDLAIDVGDGVHIGQGDYPIERIRALVPEQFIVGVTCHHVSEAQIAIQAGASYVSVGCLFPTKSKLDVVETSLRELSKIVKLSPVPVCGIGGINHKNIKKITHAGVAMAAVLSTVWDAHDPLNQLNCLESQLSSNC